LPAHVGPDFNYEDGSCNFARQQETPEPVSGSAATKSASAAANMLRIEVKTMKSPLQEFPSYKLQCPPDAKPLKGIGNEAIECAMQQPGQSGARVIGRVRDRAFLVEILANAGTATPSAQDAIPRKAERIAEQVAGNLF
jgi:hypothetical protein